MANKSKLFKSQAEDITDSMFSADVIQSRSDSEGEETPVNSRILPSFAFL